MTTFYPGPAKIYPEIRQYLLDAYDLGILSVNHRSDVFMELLQKTKQLLHQQLNIPAHYQIFFVSSATESWEIVAQSLVKKQALHIFNGAFGQKWCEYSQKIDPKTQRQSFDLNEEIHVNSAQITYSDVLCLVHNETSNGTQITTQTLATIRQQTNALIAIDATSSLGGVALNWLLGDVWLASVQKCLGLPAGLGLLVCSPRAMQQAIDIGDRRFYNSLLFIEENFSKNQTHYTPNVLGVYLLSRVLEQLPNINIIHKKIQQQANDWYAFIENKTAWQPLIQNIAQRSDTVIAISGSTNDIALLKEKCQNNNVTIGNGYGQWQYNTCRIANFPAIEPEEIEQLKQLL